MYKECKKIKGNVANICKFRTFIKIINLACEHDLGM